jgi:Xaa-Pro aminopeptidase
MQRPQKLLAAMQQQGLEAAWIISPENIRYLTGFAGEGSLFVARDGCVILTDFRYIEQAARESPGCEVVRISAQVKAENALEALCAQRALGAVAIERDRVTLDQFAKLPPALDYPPLSGLPERLRRIKDAGEIASIKKASAIACRAFDEMLGIIRPGMTEREVARELENRMFRLGSEKEAFATIACAGANGALPHAVPSDHALEKGELLTLDFGAQVDGYKTDMTRTVAIGQISGELRAIYEAVLEAQLRALEAVRPGALCRDVDGIARSYLDARYPGAFGHSLGHSVGLFIHEQPQLSANSNDALEPGHVMTVEPGVYIPGVGGCRIEDSVVVVEGGFENLIDAPKHLIVL